MDSLERAHELTVKMYRCIPDGHKQEVSAEFDCSQQYFNRCIIGGSVKSIEAHYRAQRAIRVVAQRIYDNSKRLLDQLATVQAGELEVTVDE